MIAVFIVVGLIGPYLTGVIVFGFYSFFKYLCCKRNDSTASIVAQPQVEAPNNQEEPTEERFKQGLNAASKRKYDQILSKCVYTRYESEVNVYSQKDCTICLDEFVIHVEVRILGCGHIFHNDCIKAWIKSKINGNPKCPSCICDLVNIKPLSLKNLKARTTRAET